ncbi:MAG: ABC transporter substrate-binding protein [Paracoccaceae bacterium]|nr:ABC transporter substrate-binding protein [Paracoccaceae bacterium]
MRLSGLLLAALLALTLAVPHSAAAEEDPEGAARVVAQTLVGDAHVAMTDSELADDAARAEALKAAVSQAFAFDIWERFLVGDRDLPPDDLAAFRDLLPGFLAQLYADQFGKGLEERPQINGTRKVRRDVMVSAAIPRANGDPLPVEYRVRDFAERGPLVIDVMVGGISFLVLKRDEFGGLLDQGGAERLLAFMREKSM